MIQHRIYKNHSHRRIITDIIFEEWNSLKIFNLSDLKGIRLIQVPKPNTYRRNQLKKKDRGIKGTNLMKLFSGHKTNPPKVIAFGNYPLMPVANEILAEERG